MATGSSSIGGGVNGTAATDAAFYARSGLGSIVINDYASATSGGIFTNTFSADENTPGRDDVDRPRASQSRGGVA